MKRRKIFRKIILPIIVTVMAIQSGCKKWIVVPAPYTSINQDNVYSSDPNAIGVLTQMYVQLSQQQSVNGPSFYASGWSGSLSADELAPGDGNFQDDIMLYQNAQTATTALDVWSNTYPSIFQANAAIQGLNASKTLTSAIKQQLLGEAYFMRAFNYFYLVNFYGDIPLITGTDPKINAIIGRSSTETVYQQMITDLKTAQGLLSKKFLDGTLLNVEKERVRPSYWTAAALLARVYLYHKDYELALKAATEVISDNADFSLGTLDNAFLRAGLGNNEAIWQLQPTSNTQVFTDGGYYIETSVNLKGRAVASPILLKAFEPRDQRATHWISSTTVNGATYTFPYKYKLYTISGVSDITEYEMVFRLAEQYLIRAEAEAQLGQISQAQSDLNAIRTRAGLPNTTASDQTSLLNAIYHERNVELFTEWGNRWFDLRRTGMIHSVMGGATGVCSQKGGNWASDDHQALFPIPLPVLQANPALKQNPGY